MKQEKDAIQHIEILTLENFFGEGSNFETVHRVISNMLPSVNNMPGIFRQTMAVAPSRFQLQTFFQVLPMVGTYATRHPRLFYSSHSSKAIRPQEKAL